MTSETNKKSKIPFWIKVIILIAVVLAIVYLIRYEAVSRIMQIIVGIVLMALALITAFITFFNIIDTRTKVIGVCVDVKEHTFKDETGHQFGTGTYYAVVRYENKGKQSHYTTEDKKAFPSMEAARKAWIDKRVKLYIDLKDESKITTKPNHTFRKSLAGIGFIVIFAMGAWFSFNGRLVEFISLMWSTKYSGGGA